MATLMMANIQTGRTDEALKNIATLEQSNTPGDVMVRLYVQLGQLLETEMNAARQRDDTAKLARIQGDYQRFLSAVAANDAASPDILQWAGEAMLDLDMNAEAVDVLTQAANRLKEQRDGTTNLDESQRLNTRYERALLKLTAALRKTNAFDRAAATLKPLLDRSPPLMEAMFEDCRIATAQAAARRGNWNTALAKWVELTGRLRGLKPRPPEYFEAFYELAEAQRLKGDSAEARKTLSSILKLNRRTMSSEMAKRYENALNALGSGG
jgi:tetratricopeptide (TPR) repeat protein